MTKLFVGNLSYDVKSEDLTDLFSPFGNVLGAYVITDRASGRSKGFGFVEFENDADAQKAIADMHEKDLKGRKLVVNIAKPKEEKPYGQERNGNNFKRQSY